MLKPLALTNPKLQSAWLRDASCEREIKGWRELEHKDDKEEEVQGGRKCKVSVV